MLIRWSKLTLNAQVLALSAQVMLSNCSSNVTWFPSSQEVERNPSAAILKIG